MAGKPSEEVKTDTIKEEHRRCAVCDFKRKADGSKIAIPDKDGKLRKGDKAFRLYNIEGPFEGPDRLVCAECYDKAAPEERKDMTKLPLGLEKQVSTNKQELDALKAQVAQLTKLIGETLPKKG